MSRSSAFISVGVEPAPGPHAAVAGHGRQHVVEPLGDDEAPLPLGKLVGEVAQQPLDVALAEQRRDLAHDDRGGAEGLDHEAEPLEVLGSGAEPLGALGVELDHFGDQQELPRQAAIGEGLFQALIDEPLMRRVLIDDDERVLGLGDDEGVVELRPRRAQRIVDGARRRRRSHNVSALGLPSGAKRRLARFGKAKGRGDGPLR